jgi:hypothetical protein
MPSRRPDHSDSRSSGTSSRTSGTDRPVIGDDAILPDVVLVGPPAVGSDLFVLEPDGRLEKVAVEEDVLGQEMDDPYLDPQAIAAENVLGRQALLLAADAPSPDPTLPDAHRIVGPDATSLGNMDSLVSGWMTAIDQAFGYFHQLKQQGIPQHHLQNRFRAYWDESDVPKPLPDALLVEWLRRAEGSPLSDAGDFLGLTRQTVGPKHSPPIAIPIGMADDAKPAVRRLQEQVEERLQLVHDRLDQAAATERERDDLAAQHRALMEERERLHGVVGKLTENLNSLSEGFKAEKARADIAEDQLQQALARYDTAGERAAALAAQQEHLSSKVQVLGEELSTMRTALDPPPPSRPPGHAERFAHTVAAIGFLVLTGVLGFLVFLNLDSVVRIWLGLVLVGLFVLRAVHPIKRARRQQIKHTTSADEPWAEAAVQKHGEKSDPRDPPAASAP